MFAGVTSSPSRYISMSSMFSSLNLPKPWICKVAEPKFELRSVRLQSTGFFSSSLDYLMSFYLSDSVKTLEWW